MKFLKGITQNFSLLFLMKRHYFLNFFIVAFLTKKLGIENLGKLEFCKSAAYYFYIAINFGFNYISTKRIANVEGDFRAISKIFFTTKICKLIIILATLPIFLLMITQVPKLREYKETFFFFWSVSIGSALCPIFIYQGLNKMHQLVVFDLGSKMIFFIIIVTTIKNEHDGWIYPSAYAGADALRAIASNIWIYKKEKLKFVLPTWIEIKKLFVESSSMFFAIISRTIYERLPQIIIGINLGMKSVGIYIVSVKIIGEINLLISQFTQASYPIFSKKIKNQLNHNLFEVMKLFLYSLVFVGIVSIVIFAFSTEIISIFTKKNTEEAANLLRISLFIPLLVFSYTFLGTNVLSNYGKSKIFSRTTLFISLLCMVICTLFAKNIETFIVIINIAELLCTAIIGGATWILIKKVQHNKS